MSISKLQLLKAWRYLPSDVIGTNNELLFEYIHTKTADNSMRAFKSLLGLFSFPLTPSLQSQLMDGLRAHLDFYEYHKCEAPLINLNSLLPPLSDIKEWVKYSICSRKGRKEEASLIQGETMIQSWNDLNCALMRQTCKHYTKAERRTIVTFIYGDLSQVPTRELKLMFDCPQEKENFRLELMDNKKDYGYGLCPITMLLALAFADSTFEGDLTPATFSELKDSTTTLRVLRWKESVQKKLLFRQIVRCDSSMRPISDDQGLKYGLLLHHAKRIPEAAGFLSPFIPYNIRRGTANTTYEHMATARHKQMMGHKDAKTFENNYIAYTSFADVQSLSQNEPERLDILRGIARSSSRRDINAPKKLPAKKLTEINQSPELKELDKLIEAADGDINELESAKYWLKMKLVKQALQHYREEWFGEKDHQLGSSQDDEYKLEIPSHHLKAERRRIAAGLFGSPSASRTSLLEDLVKICQSSG
ncbi:hypothetical protein K440DRAFT_644492 [Wilcoxina mikolae CBS 423.85]|nr:hypothetical protein K440DRAFT_644492 [Wilcoxina mikolae CBS 423.85]